jgi:hydroxymethylpyrimidine/phosphomethylpyrimidine kinase
MTPPIVLSIAGFDPSSGAGITADIKTIAAHRCYGTGCITAVTVQSTAGVKQMQPLPADLVRRMLDELASDMPINAVRIGMLGSADVAQAVADFLARRGLSNVVLDPILKSSSGADLLDKAGADVLRNRLLSLANVVTPNIDEAAALTHLPVTTVPEMKAAAAKLHELGARTVVVTGGHLDQPIDLFSVVNSTTVEQEELRLDRVRSRSTHGTGCAFATAIACNLALGRGVREAVLLAKAYVAQAIARAYPVGQGTGPVHHLYRMDELEKEIKTGGQFEHPREARFREGA